MDSQEGGNGREEICFQGEKKHEKREEGGKKKWVTLPDTRGRYLKSFYEMRLLYIDLRVC